MKLMLTTEGTLFQAVGGFEPRLDKDGVQRRDKSGGTNLPLNAVKLVASMVVMGYSYGLGVSRRHAAHEAHARVERLRV